MTNQKTIEKPKISPDEYRKILKGIEIENIVLTSTEAYRKATLDGELPVETEVRSNYIQKEDQFFTINCTLNLTAGTKQDNPVIRVKCEYELVFKTEYKITDDFFEVYKQLNLITSIWPFFREFVYNITSRMYLPPLTIPLFKVI